MPEFRIVVAAHGDLAGALLGAAELICGELPDVHAVGLAPEDSPESFGERFMAALGPADGSVLVLTDLAGGTPHNVAFAMARRRPATSLISGVNLAVLLEAATTQDALDSELIERLVEQGREALLDPNRALASRTG